MRSQRCSQPPVKIFIQFTKNLLSTYCVLSTVVGIGDTEMNKTSSLQWSPMKSSEFLFILIFIIVSFLTICH